jgi:hypothetical protein
MGSSQSHAVDDGALERSLAIDAELKENALQPRPIRALVMADHDSGWDRLAERMARTLGAQRVFEPARERALVLGCVARFFFRCSRDVATLLFRAALRTCDRGLCVLRFGGGTQEKRSVQVVRYESKTDRRRWAAMFERTADVVVVPIDTDFGVRPALCLGGWDEWSAEAVIANTLNTRWFLELPILFAVLHQERFDAAVAAGMLAAHFPDYSGGSDVAAGQAYLVDHVQRSNNWRQRHVRTIFVSNASDGSSELELIRQVREAHEAIPPYHPLMRF